MYFLDINGSNSIIHLLTGNHQSYTLTNADIGIEEYLLRKNQKTLKRKQMKLKKEKEYCLSIWKRRC